MSLLLHRRKITADTAKSGDPSRTPKGASNLLLNFRPAKIPLGLVVRKRNPQVVEQSQYLIGTPKQRIQQILGRTLLAPACARACGRGGWWRFRGGASPLVEARRPHGGWSQQVSRPRAKARMRKRSHALRIRAASLGGRNSTRPIGWSTVRRYLWRSLDGLQLM